MSFLRLFTGECFDWWGVVSAADSRFERGRGEGLEVKVLL